MALWNFKLEIIDNLGSPYTIDTENRGFDLTVKRNNESSLMFKARNINNIKTKLVQGNEVTVYGDYNTTPVTKQFAGVELDPENLGTFQDYTEMFCRDICKDRRLSKTVNKKYASQDVKLTAQDIVDNFMGGGFTTTAMQTIGISQPYNFVKELVDLALQRITDSSVSEIFMKPTKDVVMRPLFTEDSGLTITDTNLFNPEEISWKRGIAQSAGIVTVVGGLDVNSKRVIASKKIPNAPSYLASREFPKIDTRFTTFVSAKAKATSIANQIGKNLYLMPPLQVRDLTAIPRPGTMVNLNSTLMGITNTKFVVNQVNIHVSPGNIGEEAFVLHLGDTEEDELETINMLWQDFESNKRKDLDADNITNQAQITVAEIAKSTMLVTITARDPSTNPYLWSDGIDSSSDFDWAYWTFGDGT